MFMARAVRRGGPLGRFGAPAWFQKVPELSQKAQVYGDVFPERLTRFQQSPGSPDDHIVRVGTHPDSSSLRHELHHDAESAFWLLVWWVVNAAAPTDDRTSEIPIGLWAAFVDTKADNRPWNIASDCLDPAYAPLSELLDQLGQALESDLHWATDTPYTHPEFLHEVFQRHILNFIFENRDKSFMKLAKAGTSRKPAKLYCYDPSILTNTLFFRSCSRSSKRSRDSDSDFDSVSCLLFISHLQLFYILLLILFQGTLKKSEVHHK